MGMIERDNKLYAKILADGTMRIPTNEQDPEHEKRVVDLTDGSTKTYIERVLQGYKGKIQGINFREMDFGTMINVVFQQEPDEARQFVLSMNASSNFASDFMEKLPNVDLNKEISISPWAMKKDNGKISKGMVVWQLPDGAVEGTAKIKVGSFFKKYEEGKKPETINGFPTPENGGKGLSKDDWKIYFMQVKKFLIKYTEDNIIPKLFDVSGAGRGSIDDAVDTGNKNVEEDIKVEDIPL